MFLSDFFFLFFLLNQIFFFIFQAQNRGAAKFNSSPQQVPQNGDWNLGRLHTRTIDRRISDDGDASLRSQPEIDQRKPIQRPRGRQRSTATPSTTTLSTISTIDEVTFGDNMKNVPVVRVRGRNRNKLLDRGSIPSNDTSSIRAVKKSVNQVASKEPNVVSSRPAARDEMVPLRGQRPSNHRSDHKTVSNLPQNENGRRIRVRIVQPNNAVANNVNTTKNETETLQRHRPTPMQQEKVLDGGGGGEEPNYPEHFKMLLKAKKTTESATKPENRRSSLIPAKKFQPTVVTSSTTSLPFTNENSAPITSSHNLFKHKKIVRPNKLLFPSLQTSLTTTTTTNRPSQSTTVNVGSQIEDESLLLNANSDSGRTTFRKPTPTTKFSSKIRNMEHLPSSGFKMRVIATGINGSQEIIARNDTPPAPTYQRFSAVSFQFTN